MSGGSPKVLLLGGALMGGGAETRLRLIAKRLFEGNLDIAVLKNGHSGDLHPQQRVFELGWSGDFSYPIMALRLRRLIQRHAYDAVLAMGFYPNLLALIATRGRRLRPAVIATENTRPHTTSGLYYGAKRRALFAALNRQVYGRADLCAANSQDGMAEIVRYFGADPARVRRIPNLVEPDGLAALAAAEGPIERCRPPSLCVVSRLDRLKRVDVLLTAAAGVTHLDWRVDLVGDGPERQPLAALAHQLGIGERVHFHGWRQNPYPIMARASAVVLCSTLEGFSNTVIEAMALRVPVITSLCSSDAAHMCQTHAALGFNVDDVEALRIQIERVLSDRKMVVELSKNAWQYAQPHTPAQAIPAYEALVEDAIRNLGRRRSQTCIERPQLDRVA